MQYALNRGEGFLVVTGSPGTGKTTLIDDILSQIDEAHITVVSLLSARLRPDDMLHMVAMSLGVSCNEARKSDQLAGIEQALIQQHRSRRRVVLMVDEAQDLSFGVLEELRLLSDMQLGSRLLLQVFLVGQQPLVQLVKRPNMEHLRQRIIAAAHLKPMSQEDTAAFMVYRLMRAGWREDPVITPQALASIHNFSGGVPRLINQVCSRLLFFGAVEEQHTLDRDAVDTVIDGMQVEMLFGDADADPQPKKNRSSSEPGPAISQEARAAPVTLVVPEKTLQPLDPDVALSAYVDVVAKGLEHPPNLDVPELEAVGQAVTKLAIRDEKERDEITIVDVDRNACATTHHPALVSEPTSDSRDERAYIYEDGVGQIEARAWEERREISVFPETWQAESKPKRHHVPLAVFLVAVTAIGYQLRTTGSFAVWESLSQWFQAVEAPPVDGRIEHSSVFSEGPRETQQDQTDVETVLSTDRKPTLTAKSPYPESATDGVLVGTQDVAPSRTNAALESKPAAALEPEIAVMALETTDVADRSANAAARMDEFVILKSGPAKGTLEAGMTGFGTGNRHDNPGEVQAWLYSGHWSVSGEPAAMLPSTVSRCQNHDHHIICWSAPQQVRAGLRDAIYQVQSTIDDFSTQGVFKVRYRVMESVLSVNDPDLPGAMRVNVKAGRPLMAQETTCRAIDSSLVRCRGGVDAVFRLGWKVTEQETTCKAIGSNLIRCRGGVDGVFRLGWKVIEQEMMCKAIDSSLVRCRGGAGDVFSYLRNN